MVTTKRFCLPFCFLLYCFAAFELGQGESTFSVFWNAPSESCQNRGIKLDLDKFEIKHNKELKFKGSVITLFYADYSKFGVFPYVDRDGKEVNGGIPQRSNLTRHLSLVKENIESSLRPDFDGLAVIDWEIWRPLFDRNWGKMRVYQRLSIDYVKKRFPTLSTKASLAKARKEWNESAKTLLMSTLKLAAELRPKAQWGFYKFPECYNYAAQHPWCGTKVESMDDELFWLWNASTVLYPSAYFGEDYPKSFEEKKNLVRGHVDEAFRVGRIGKTNLPVFFYMKYSYSSTTFATKEDLEASLQLAADMGAAGAILWDASAPFHDRSYCERIRTDLDSLLGPFAKRVVDEARSCGANRCSLHGRCALANAQAFMAPHVSPSEVSPNQKVFQCRCFNGWKGDSCQEKM